MAKYVIEEEHSYAFTQKSRPDLSNITNEEIIDSNDQNMTPDLNAWRNGRREVELGVLVDALSSCQRCGLPLSLYNCVGINTHGLAATLRILCVNTSCQFKNVVPTGKKHGHVWDVNTKLAAGKYIFLYRYKK